MTLLATSFWLVQTRILSFAQMPASCPFTHRWPTTSATTQGHPSLESGCTVLCATFQSCQHSQGAHERPRRRETVRRGDASCRQGRCSQLPPDTSSAGQPPALKAIPWGPRFHLKLKIGGAADQSRVAGGDGAWSSLCLCCPAAHRTPAASFGRVHFPRRHLAPLPCDASPNCGWPGSLPVCTPRGPS